MRAPALNGELNFNPYLHRCFHHKTLSPVAFPDTDTLSYGRAQKCQSAIEVFMIKYWLCATQIACICQVLIIFVETQSLGWLFI